MNLREIAALLRRKGAIESLLRELGRLITMDVPVDAMRFDLTDDRGALWSRIVKPGEDPVGPALGSVERLRTREQFEVTQKEGTHQLTVPLGLGDPATGRWILKRKSGPFTEAELDAIRGMADVISLGLRARPFDAPPKLRSRFAEEPLV